MMLQQSPCTSSSCPRAARPAWTSAGILHSTATSRPSNDSFVKRGRLESGLDVHAAIDHVRDKLRVGLRLIPAAHDAERDARVAAGHERRNDRVQRAFARREHVGMPAIEREQRAAILQRKAGALGHDARSEAREIALNQRHHVAVAIGHAEICRISGVHRQRARLGARLRRSTDRSARPARARIPCSASHRPARRRISDRRRAAACRHTPASSPRSSTCSASTELCATSDSGNASRMFNIISAAMPAPLGGSSKISHPRYVVEMGSTHCARNFARSAAAIVEPRRFRPATRRRATSVFVEAFPPPLGNLAIGPCQIGVAEDFAESRAAARREGTSARLRDRRAETTPGCATPRL